jgi:ribosome-associated heat shock protein Hsp15
MFFMSGTKFRVQNFYKHSTYLYPMEQGEKRVRIDKWLWAVRQYKTRTLATEACDQGRIRISDQVVKPSRLIKEGDEISIRRTGITRKIKVLKITENRIGAKLLPEHLADLTPQEELDAFKARTTRITIYRDPGTGRPTKRDRRILDDFFNNEGEENG